MYGAGKSRPPPSHWHSFPGLSSGARRAGKGIGISLYHLFKVHICRDYCDEVKFCGEVLWPQTVESFC